MKIVVVGAGHLGYSLAQQLSKEQNDVIVIDKDPDQLEPVKNTLDVLTILANATRPSTLDDADVRGADLLIAVTESDEVNMITCTLAKKNNIKHTIARIRDLTLFEKSQNYLKETFLIDVVLNPDLITAREIFRILMMPAALNVEDFAGGKVRLFETKVSHNSKYANVSLKDLHLPASILVGMIFRDGQMIIPHGNDKFLPMDNAYFIGRTEDIAQFSENFAKRKARKLKRVLIIGAGRTGLALAEMFDKEGITVKVIDKNREACEKVAERLNSGIAICGDGTDIDLLTEETIGQADAVVCLTGDDKLNLMIALLAKHLGAMETVVRVARTEYVDLMVKVGVDIVVSGRLLSSSEVLAFVRRGAVEKVSLLEGAKAEAIEVVVQRKAPVAYLPLKDANLPKECLVCAYVRDDEAFIPNGNSVLLPDDRIILFIQTQFAKKVMSYFRSE